MDQAKKALKFCLDKLQKQDRFAIVQFSTSAETYADGWTDATEDNLKKAGEWVGKMEAAGGTTISGALAKAFALKYDDARPATVIFITDGQPTVDVTDPEAILKTVKENNKRNLRIFTFGVGDDVNAKLLDRIAGETGGLPEYVHEGEAVDGKITRLASKMTHPVLTGLSLEVTNVKVAETFPKDLPDLFRGSQVVLVGTYTGDGPGAVRLKGSVGAKKEEFVYEETFPKKSTDKAFIGSLYAQRKIGFLLDQIRLHGENKELKDEVVRLSLAYGIETPYTSYLVLENDKQYAQYGINRDQSLGRTKNTFSGVSVWSPVPTAVAPAAPPASGPAREEASRVTAAKVADMYGGGGRGGASTGATNSLAGPGEQSFGLPMDQSGALHGVTADDLEKADAGKTAVDIAEKIQRLRQTEGDRTASAAKMVQYRGGRQFVNFRGVWVDERFQGTEQVTKIKWGSEAYFSLLRANPELKEILSLGERVVIATAKGKAVAIDSEEGADKMTADEVKALTTDAPEAKEAEKK